MPVFLPACRSAIKRNTATGGVSACRRSVVLAIGQRMKVCAIRCARMGAQRPNAEAFSVAAPAGSRHPGWICRQGLMVAPIARPRSTFRPGAFLAVCVRGPKVLGCSIHGDRLQHAMLREQGVCSFRSSCQASPLLVEGARRLPSGHSSRFARLPVRRIDLWLFLRPNPRRSIFASSQRSRPRKSR